MTTYELTTGTREDFTAVEAQLIADITEQFTGAEVSTRMLGSGKIIECLNPCNNFESLIFVIHYDLDETKSYGAAAAIASGGLRFADESMHTLWDSFMEVHINLKQQLITATEEAWRREREALKQEKKRKELEKKLTGFKASAEKEFNNLINNHERITETDEFYYALGWLAGHVGTITAKMPDYLEESFIKHFGDVEHTTVDSTKVGPAGFTSQWHLSMEASLKKAENIPAMFTKYLSQNGKKLSKTSFVWSLVDDFGFKFGKKQDVVEILRCVPIEYVYVFNEGMKA